MASDLPVLQRDTFQAWWDWLEEHHPDSPGVWLKIAKLPTPGLSYAEALEAALCFGWIDGQKGKLDERHYLQRFTRRRRQSPWSRINRDKATDLIEKGQMQPAGQVQVDEAKADGRWARAYAGARTATLPDDLAQALAADPQAQAFFDALDSTNRYAILFRVAEAKRPETRARRIARFVEMCQRGETVHPKRPSK